MILLTVKLLLSIIYTMDIYKIYSDITKKNLSSQLSFSKNPKWNKCSTETSPLFREMRPSENENVKPHLQRRNWTPWNTFCLLPLLFIIFVNIICLQETYAEFILAFSSHMSYNLCCRDNGNFWYFGLFIVQQFDSNSHSYH